MNLQVRLKQFCCLMRIRLLLFYSFYILVFRFNKHENTHTRVLLKTMANNKYTVSFQKIYAKENKLVLFLLTPQIAENS